MQKFLVIVLAVCLISVQAFVKREAPAPASDSQTSLDSIQKALGDLGNQLKEQFDKANANIDPETVKKGLQDFTNTINDMINNIQKPGAEKKE